MPSGVRGGQTKSDSFVVVVVVVVYFGFVVDLFLFLFAFVLVDFSPFFVIVSWCVYDWWWEGEGGYFPEFFTFFLFFSY